MSNRIPPIRLSGGPNLTTLAAGAVLFRVHQTRFDAAAFNPEPAHRYYGGGRFDSTEDDRYEYLYAGESVGVAIAETFLRDIAYSARASAVLPRKAFAGRRISAVRLVRDCALVSLLDLADLSRAAQSTWLTQCEPRDYAQSRHWAHFIRSQAPNTDGFVWQSKREPARKAYLLYKQDPTQTLVEQVPHFDVPTGDRAIFDTSLGRTFLRSVVNPYRVTLRV